MPRLLNILGFLAFLVGAALVGYVLYLVLAGILGINPWGNGRPQVATNTLIGMGVAALLFLVAGWLLARASARAEWRRAVADPVPSH